MVSSLIESKLALPPKARIIGFGVDWVSVAVIREIIARYTRDVLKYLFTEHELNIALENEQPESHLSICFGLKEAVGKALGTGMAGINWFDIELEKSCSSLGGLVNLYGKANERAVNLGITGWSMWKKELPDSTVYTGVVSYG